MLTTLLGEQFRSTTRWVASVVGVVMLIVVVSLVPGFLGLSMLGGLGAALAVVLLILLVPIVLTLLAGDYWQSMSGRRASFTHTLPVRGRELYAAKVLHALIVAAVTGAVALGGLGLTLVAHARMDGVGVGEEWRSTLSSFDALPGALAGVVVAVLVLEFVVVIIQVPAVLSIASESRFQGLGWGAPLIGLILLYLADQLVNLIGMLFLPVGIVLTGRDAGSFVARGMLGEMVSALRTGAQPSVIGLGSFATNLVLTAVLVWWGVRSIERHTSVR